LEEYKTATSGSKQKIGAHWLDKIKTRITENENIFGSSGPGGGDKFKKGSDLDKLITAETGDTKAKKVYQEFKNLPKDNPLKTDEVFDQLKDLVEKLKKTNPLLTEIKPFSIAAATDNKKKA